MLSFGRGPLALPKCEQPEPEAWSTRKPRAQVVPQGSRARGHEALPRLSFPPSPLGIFLPSSGCTYGRAEARQGQDRRVRVHRLPCTLADSICAEKARWRAAEGGRLKARVSTTHTQPKPQPEHQWSLTAAGWPGALLSPCSTAQSKEDKMPAGEPGVSRPKPFTLAVQIKMEPNFRNKSLMAN